MWEQGDDGSYGTSVTWVKAMDPASDILVAYKQVGLDRASTCDLIKWHYGLCGSGQGPEERSHCMMCAVAACCLQNGRWLTPDHGFPVRLIIPGYIGGRMIKWLSEISVTESESQNHYHFFDNRVLPSHVDQELANKEGEWGAGPGGCATQGGHRQDQV